MIGTDRIALADLLLGDGWEEFAGETSLDGGGWQIVVSEPEESAGDYVYGVTLEPAGSREDAVQRLADVVRTVARQTRGHSLDPVTGEEIDFRE